MAETLNKIRRRFTFVEALVVVLVIGILSAVIVPRFNRSEESPESLALAAAVQAVRTQIDDYKRQNDGRLPDLSSDLFRNVVQNGGATVKNGIAIGTDASVRFLYDYGTHGDGTGRFWGVDRGADGRPILIGD